MLELDHKECWTQKNCCFWAVVLEKTLESPLDCKEIKPVNPKGYQFSIFIRRTYADAKTPILWPPDVKNQLIWNDPDAGVTKSQTWLSDWTELATPWTAACEASLSITNSQSLLKFMSIESVMPSNHLILYCPLLLLASIFPSIRVFSVESFLRVRWPKYWSFSLSISPSEEYSGLISFRMGWLDLLEVRGTLKSLLQHHSSKASLWWVG